MTEVRLWLLRKTPSTRPYTALGLFGVVAVDFCFSSLKSFHLLTYSSVGRDEGKGLVLWQWRGGGRAASTQKRKGREYKEVSRLAEKSIPTKRREEKESSCVC